jgi:hypothetical protein
VVCETHGEDHETVWETVDERRRDGRPVGQAFLPFHEAPQVAAIVFAAGAGEGKRRNEAGPQRPRLTTTTQTTTTTTAGRGRTTTRTRASHGAVATTTPLTLMNLNDNSNNGDINGANVSSSTTANIGSDDNTTATPIHDTSVGRKGTASTRTTSSKSTSRVVAGRRPPSSGSNGDSKRVVSSTTTTTRSSLEVGRLPMPTRVSNTIPTPSTTDSFCTDCGRPRVYAFRLPFLSLPLQLVQ